MRKNSRSHVLLLGTVALLLFAIPALGQHPGPVAGAQVASEVSVKLVTDEFVLRPPRRPDGPLYLCTASFRSSPEDGHPWGGELRVVLFSGESETRSTEVKPGIRAELTCSVDATIPKAAVSLVVTSAARQPRIEMGIVAVSTQPGE